MDVPHGPVYDSKTSAWVWTEHASWPETAHDGARLVAVALLPGQASGPDLLRGQATSSRSRCTSAVIRSRAVVRDSALRALSPASTQPRTSAETRSEERRGGEEWRARW